MRVLTSLILTWCGLLGCASAPQPVGDSAPVTYGRENGLVWVRGPWDAIKPSANMDDVIDQLCPAVTALPGARDGDYGREYCGAIYTLDDDGIYYASFPSPLGPTVLVGSSQYKQCNTPNSVKDERGNASIKADFHGHPWGPSPMSDKDRRSNTQIYFVRIQFDSRCQIMKLIPHRKDNLPGELFVRQGKEWKLIGHILPEDKATGTVTYIKE